MSTYKHITETGRGDDEELKRNLLELGHRLGDAKTLRQVATIILETAEVLFGWDAAYLNLYSSSDSRITSIVSMDTIDGKRVEVHPEQIVSPLSPIARSVLSKGAQLFHLGESTDKYKNHPSNFGDTSKPSQTAMYAPVRTMGQHLGILSIQSYQPRAYTEEQLDAFQALADHCSGGVIRTQAEEAAALLRATLEASAEAIVVVTTGGRVVDYNHNAEEILAGASIESGNDFVPSIRKDLLAPEDFDRYLAEGPEEGCDPIILETKRQTVLEASYRPQLLSQEVNGYVWTFRDITEKHRAAERIERSEAIYRNAIENSQGVPYRLIYGRPTYDFMGNGIKNIVGRDKDHFTVEELNSLIRETELLDDFPTKDLQEYRRRFRQGHSKQYRTDIRIVDYQNEEKWISDCAVPLHNEDGEVIGSLGILQDITFRKRAEIEQRRENEARVLDLRRENDFLRQRLAVSYLSCPEAFEEIITQDMKMRIIFRYVEAIAATNEPVVIVGETGVGKELMARSVHRASGRQGKYVTVNVAGLDDNMFSDTLFGHVQGAFTDANRMREGLIERAKDGTLFLDEIGDLEQKSQIKLLRLIQEGEYYPVGSDRVKKSRTRFLFATNRNLRELVATGEFRKDLYFRLQTHVIEIPPLRERPDDIDLLVDHLIDRAATKLGKKRPTLPKAIYPLLRNYSFPGNVRELEAIIFDAVSKHVSKVMSLEVIKERIRNGFDPEFAGGGVGSNGALSADFEDSDRLPSIKEATTKLIREALRRADGNQSVASRMLGITQQALSQRIKRDPALTENS